MQTDRSKVLILSAHYLKLDRRIISQANALVASGREVTLLTVPIEMLQPTMDAGVRIVAPKWDDRPLRQMVKKVILCLPDPLYHIVRATLDRWVVNKYRNLFCRLWDDEDCNVVHCHDLPTLPAALELRAKLAPTAKVVYDSHELYPFQWTDGALQEYWTSLEQEYINEADLVITVNDSIAEEMQRLYGIKKPEVIYNSYGIASSEKVLSEEEFLAYFGAPPEGFRVLFVGGFLPGRNLDRLVEAFGMLDGSTRLFMLGEGEAQKRIERICRKKRISNVHVGQWVPQHELLQYVSKADMGIIPYTGDLSLNNLFCTPNKLFEFIECGIPICASDLPELRKIVRGWGIGDVYAMTTPAEMAQAVSDCVSRCKQGEFGEARLRAAREEFGWPKQEQKLLRLYSELGV